MLRRLGPGHRALVTTALTLCVGLGGAVGPAAATTHRTLAGRQVDRIVAMTGYRGLRSHEFDVASKFEAGDANFVVVRLDRARLAVPLTEIQRDLRLAARLAARRRAFTSKVKVGRGAEQDITFDVRPGGRSAPREPYLHAIIVVSHRQRLGALTRPERMARAQALTVISDTARLNVTLLHDSSRGALWGPGLSAESIETAVECFNTTSLVHVARKTVRRLDRQGADMSYLADPGQPDPSRRQEFENLAVRGLEIWSNSLGFAIVAARSGTAYEHYVRQARHMRFAFYRRNDLRYLTVAAAEYRRFARS
jgi:hypothetical protein